MIRYIVCFSILIIFATCNTGNKSKRTIISLNGEWNVEETNEAEVVPSNYSKKVPVPGLIDLATGALFDSVGYATSDKRYYWHQRKFELNREIPDVALLKIHKAKYTTKVFLNGEVVGENPYNFTPTLFNIKPYLKEKGENELLVRISTHDNCPDTIQYGNDFEKLRYIPGVYDDVELILSGDNFIENVQLVPDIENSNVRVVTQLKTGFGNNEISYCIREYKSGKEVARGKSICADFSISIPECQLWTPENPFLYTLELETDNDSYTTRFGMRTFRLDSKSGRAILNGKPYFMRGTNVTLFRFFEDPKRNKLPWDKEWVRKLHRKFKTMHWNSIRYCIGFPPDFWYDIADEEGFLIQDEYPVWYWTDEIIDKLGINFRDTHNEYARWIYERWNHPCVVIWDAQNETTTAKTGEAIKKVRHLDLSNRPWDNGWGAPVDENDAQEVHPYLYIKYFYGEKLSNDLIKEALSDTIRRPGNGPSEHPLKPLDEKFDNPFINNEYAWLWINRDGTPTSLTDSLYAKAFGEMSPNELRYVYARHLGMKTEYWRVHRQCAAIMQFCGLGYSRPEEPKGQTSDNLIDLENIEFEPLYEKYVKDAFSPVGLMINWFEPKVQQGTESKIEIILINDTYTNWEGKVSLKLINVDKLISEKVLNASISAIGKTEIEIPVAFRNNKGKSTLTAELIFNNDTVQSIREFIIE